MRKATMTFCLIGSGFIILDSLNFGYQIAGFLLGGVIPYTSLVITPDQMFAFVAFIAGFFMSRVMMNFATRVPSTIKTKKTLRA